MAESVMARVLRWAQEDNKTVEIKIVGAVIQDSARSLLVTVAPARFQHIDILNTALKDRQISSEQVSFSGGELLKFSPSDGSYAVSETTSMTLGGNGLPANSQEQVRKEVVRVLMEMCSKKG